LSTASRGPSNRPMLRPKPFWHLARLPVAFLFSERSFRRNQPWHIPNQMSRETAPKTSPCPGPLPLGSMSREASGLARSPRRTLSQPPTLGSWARMTWSVDLKRPRGSRPARFAGSSRTASDFPSQCNRLRHASFKEVQCTLPTGISFHPSLGSVAARRLGNPCTSTPRTHLASCYPTALPLLRSPTLRKARTPRSSLVSARFRARETHFKRQHHLRSTRNRWCAGLGPPVRQGSQHSRFMSGSRHGHQTRLVPAARCRICWRSSSS